MPQPIISTVLGPLTQYETFSDWWQGGPIRIPFFDDLELPVAFMEFEPDADPAFISEADEALTHFLSLDGTYRESISPYVYKNYKEALDAADMEGNGKKLPDIQPDETIWRFVYPTDIYVERRDRRDRDIYVQLACECAWEPMHGLQLVFRKGKKLTRVSSQDGHLTEADARHIPDEADELLAQFGTG